MDRRTYLSGPPASGLIIGLFIAHLAALVFGLLGILVMVPNPRLWSGDPAATQVFVWGMAYAGSLHIILGAATMLLAGARALGWWRVAVFFVLAVCLSLSIELMGTGTGWPFGAYEYTSGLGLKVLGRVPYSIPLSWFYMGLASYLLACLIVQARGWRNRAALGVLLGAWLLVVWDLVLDPAMAHETLPVRFWVWHQTGPYFGMPVQNFVGWAGTALLFMGLSRWLWRMQPGRDEVTAWVPFGVYLANTVFAAVLSASVGLWLPILLAAALGVAPIVLGLRPPRRAAGGWRPDGARAGEGRAGDPAPTVTG
jgi:carotene biosynthesis associated membrane protein